MGWVLEVAKMFLYISFPVGIFYYVNQPAYFEEYVIKAKQQYYPPESRRANEQMDNFIRDFNTTMEKNVWKPWRCKAGTNIEENTL